MKMMSGKISELKRAPMGHAKPRLSGRRWQSIRAAVIARDAMTCQACGLMTPDVQIDHVMPVQMGGGDNLENLQCLCHDCHVAKTAADVRRMAGAW